MNTKLRLTASVVLCLIIKPETSVSYLNLSSAVRSDKKLNRWLDETIKFVPAFSWQNVTINHGAYCARKTKQIRIQFCGMDVCTNSFSTNHSLWFRFRRCLFSAGFVFQILLLQLFNSAVASLVSGLRWVTSWLIVSTEEAVVRGKSSSESINSNFSRPSSQ